LILSRKGADVHKVLVWGKIIVLLATANFAYAGNTGSIMVSDHFFFVEKMGDLRNTYGSYGLARASENASGRRIVHPGEVFGFRVHFNPVFKNIPLHIRLKVPSKPENFPVRDGSATYGSDGKSVLVDRLIDGGSGTTAFYWGIGQKDPTGQYELSFSLDGVEVTSYQFTVDKGE